MLSILTRYRPESFAEVVGQDAVVRSLESAIKKRASTAFLFTGPSGTGKTTLARIAALELGCLPADLEEYDAATKTGIEDIRQVIDGLLYRPLGEGTIKGVIIDEIQGLGKAASTALLKALEDPPDWVVWFLCTTDPAKLLKAIKTRCLSYELKEIRSSDLLDLLKSTDEAKDLDDSILRLCASEAQGSARQALANLGVCSTAESRDEAAELLHSAADAPAAFELARLLMREADWPEISEMLAKLKDTNPESVRHVVRAYMTKVMLEPKNRKGMELAFDVLKAFSEPFNSFDGITPLVLACGKLVLGEPQ